MTKKNLFENFFKKKSNFEYIFSCLVYSIFAFIKKLRFPIVLICRALKESPVLGSLFNMVN